MPKKQQDMPATQLVTASNPNPQQQRASGSGVGAAANDQGIDNANPDGDNMAVASDKSHIKYYPPPFMAALMVEHLDQFNEGLKTGQQWFKDNKPPLSKDELRALLPANPVTTFDENYTQEDEEQVQREWRDDPLRQYMMEKGGNNQMVKLWKTMVRLWGTFPEYVIGPMHNLGYDAAKNNIKVVEIDGRTYPHPYWSKSFCGDLANLIPHPFWLGQPDDLPVCLQYIVRCRTNDQRKGRWPETNPTDWRFLDYFAEVAESFQDGTRTMVELHRETDRRLGGRPSLASRLFHEIEKLSFNPAIQPLRSNVSPTTDIYLVIGADLQHLQKALDNISFNGVNYFLQGGSSLYGACLKNMRKGHDVPDERELEEFREPVLIEVRRQRLRVEKARANAVKSPQQQQQQEEGLLAGPQPLPNHISLVSPHFSRNPVGVPMVEGETAAPEATHVMGESSRVGSSITDITRTANSPHPLFTSTLPSHQSHDGISNVGPVPGRDIVMTGGHPPNDSSVEGTRDGPVLGNDDDVPMNPGVPSDDDDDDWEDISSGNDDQQVEDASMLDRPENTAERIEPSLSHPEDLEIGRDHHMEDIDRENHQQREILMVRDVQTTLRHSVCKTYPEAAAQVIQDTRHYSNGGNSPIDFNEEV